jgi:hypothetical protein
MRKALEDEYEYKKKIMEKAYLENNKQLVINKQKEFYRVGSTEV